MHIENITLGIFPFSVVTWHSRWEIEEIDTKMKTSLFPFVRRLVLFHGTPSIVSDALQALLGTTRTEARRRRKFIKYLKVRKRLLSPAAINFHLHFIFVSFVPLARERSGARTNERTNERWAGTEKKKLQKEDEEDVRWLKCRRGNIEERLDDAGRSLCVRETVFLVITRPLEWVSVYVIVILN